MKRVDVKQQLRLDTLDAGRVLEQGNNMLEQLCLDLLGGIAAAHPFLREHIADDRFSLLVHAECVAEHAAVFNRDKAGKHTCIEVLKQEVDGGAVVPVETVGPDAVLRFQHGAQAGGGKVAQIENLKLRSSKLGRGGHARGLLEGEEYSFKRVACSVMAAEPQRGRFPGPAAERGSAIRSGGRRVWQEVRARRAHGR